MYGESMIVAGDKVDVVGERGRTYVTMVEDVVENALFLIGIPRNSGTQMPLNVDDEMTLVFYRETGRYSARVRVAGFEKKGDVRYAMLLLSSKPQLEQSRGAYRLPTRIEVRVCKYIEGIEKKLSVFGAVADTTVVETVRSRDVSATGVAIMTMREYGLGEKYLLKLFLNKLRTKKPPFLICAKTVRFVPWRESGMNNVGMQYFGQTKYMSEYLLEFMQAEQRRQLKERRAAEG